MKTFLFALALAAVVPACAASSSPDEATGSNDQMVTDDASLKSITVVKGRLDNGTLRVAYDPTEYAIQKPFLGVVIPAGSGTVNVAGNFPGSPDVIVVDRQFNVLGQTQGVAAEEGKTASIAAPAVPGLVLIRDMGWVQPMEFDVSLQ